MHTLAQVSGFVTSGGMLSTLNLLAQSSVSIQGNLLKLPICVFPVKV